MARKVNNVYTNRKGAAFSWSRCLVVGFALLAFAFLIAPGSDKKKNDGKSAVRSNSGGAGGGGDIPSSSSSSTERTAKATTTYDGDNQKGNGRSGGLLRSPNEMVNVEQKTEIQPNNKEEEEKEEELAEDGNQSKKRRSESHDDEEEADKYATEEENANKAEKAKNDDDGDGDGDGNEQENVDDNYLMNAEDEGDDDDKNKTRTTNLDGLTPELASAGKQLTNTVKEAILDVEVQSDQEVSWKMDSLKAALSRVEDTVKFGLGKLFGSETDVSEDELEEIAMDVSTKLEREVEEDIRTRASDLIDEKETELQKVVKIDERSPNVDAESIRSDVKQVELALVNDLLTEIDEVADEASKHLKEKAARIEVEAVSKVLSKKGKSVKMVGDHVEKVVNDDDRNKNDNNDDDRIKNDDDYDGKKPIRDTDDGGKKKAVKHDHDDHKADKDHHDDQKSVKHDHDDLKDDEDDRDDEKVEEKD